MDVVENQHSSRLNTGARVEIVPVVHDAAGVAEVEGANIPRRPRVLRTLEADDGETLIASLSFDLLRELLVAGEVGHRTTTILAEVLAREQADERLPGAGGQLNCGVTGDMAIGAKNLALPWPQRRNRGRAVPGEEIDVRVGLRHAERA